MQSRAIAGRLRDSFGIRSLDDALFYMGYAIWLFIIIQGLTFYTTYTAPIADYVRYSSLAVIIASEILAIARGLRWSWKSLVALAVTGLLMLSCYRANVPWMFWMMPVLFCGRNRSIEGILKVTIIVFAIVFIVAVLGAYSGVIENYISKGARTRQYMGFRYPLYPATMLFIITCALVFVRKRNTDYHTLLALALAAVVTFFTTGSRLSFVLTSIAIIVSAALKLMNPSKPKSFITTCLLSCGFLVAAAVSIALSAFYDPTVEWMKQLDMILGGRLHLGHDGLIQYGVSLFGQQVDLISNTLSASGTRSKETYNFIDSIYVQFIVRFGILYFIIFMIGMTMACFTAFRRGDMYAGVVFTLLAIHGIVENTTFYLWINPFMFYAIMLLAEKPVFRNNKKLRAG